MRQAGVVHRTGGPFGAVVLRDHDPTAHAEVNAIRQACRTLGSHDLTGAVLYASGECCPMGDAAACWARIDKVSFASRWSDDADLFDDAHIHAHLARPNASWLPSSARGSCAMLASTMPHPDGAPATP